jgi:hypothetical protein
MMLENGGAEPERLRRAHASHALTDVPPSDVWWPVSALYLAAA